MDIPAAWLQRSERIIPAIAVGVVHLILGYALIAGLRVALPLPPAAEALAVFDLEPPPPPEKPPPPPAPREPIESGGAPSGPATATPPPDPLHQIVPLAPPVLTLPVPAVRVAPPVVSGTALPAGTGTGGGGSGTGAGRGSGVGDGEGEGFSGARQIRGRFRNSDFPNSAKGAGPLKVGVRYAVGPSGRVENCEIIEPSGYPEVDAMTCRVIVDRYRFRPARDGEGSPVTEVMEEDYRWKRD